MYSSRAISDNVSLLIHLGKISIVGDSVQRLKRQFLCNDVRIIECYFNKNDRGDFIRNSPFKKWTITILVFWGIYKILFFTLKDIIFGFINISEPYNSLLQIIGHGFVILLSGIFTTTLVDDPYEKKIE